MDKSAVIVSFLRNNISLNIDDILYILFDKSLRTFAEKVAKEGVYLTNGFYFQPTDWKITPTEILLSSQDVILQLKSQKELGVFKPVYTPSHGFPKNNSKFISIRLHPSSYMLQFTDGQKLELKSVKNIFFASGKYVIETIDNVYCFNSDILQSTLIPVSKIPEYNFRIVLKDNTVIYSKFVSFHGDNIFCSTPFGETIQLSLKDVQSFEFVENWEVKDLEISDENIDRLSLNPKDNTIIIQTNQFKAIGKLNMTKDGLTFEPQALNRDISSINILLEKYIEKWRFSLERSWSIKAFDIDFQRKVIYAGTSDGFVVALNFAGKLLWNSLPKYGSINGLSVHSSGILLSNEDGQITKFSLPQSDYSLKEEWTKSVGERLTSGILTFGTGNFFVTSSEGNVYELDERGNIRRITIGEQITSKGFVDSSNVLWIGDKKGRLHRIKDGKILLTVNLNRIITSGIIIDTNDNVYFGTLSGDFVSMKKDGKINWEIKTNSPIKCSPVMNNDGEIFFGNDKGQIYCITKDGKTKWIQNVGEPVRKNFVLVNDSSGNFIYVIDEGQWISCFTQSGKFESKLSGKLVFETDLKVLYDGVRNIVLFGAQGNKIGAVYKTERGLEFLWSNWVGSYTLSAPVLDKDGNLYFGGWDGYLYSLSPLGTLRWKIKLDGPIHTRPALYKDDTVYITSMNKVYAVDKNGKLKWTQPFSTRSLIYASVVIGDDGTVYVAGMDKNLYALDEFGKKKWEFTADNMLYTSPVIGKNGNIYVLTTSGTLYCFDAMGSKKWELNTGLVTYSSLLLTNTNELVFGSVQGTMVVVNALTGQEIFRRNIGQQIYSALLVDNNRSVYFGTTGGLYKLSLNDKTTKMVLSTSKSIFSSPLIDTQGRIYVPCTDGTIYVVSGKDEFLWKMEISTDIRSNLTLSSKGLLYVLSTDGYLYCFQTVSITN